MTRDEKLVALAEVLMLAAAKARGLAHAHGERSLREIALSTQIEGIAMEFKALGLAGIGRRDRKSD